MTSITFKSELVQPASKPDHKRVADLYSNMVAILRILSYQPGQDYFDFPQPPSTVIDRFMNLSDQNIYDFTYFWINEDLNYTNEPKTLGYFLLLLALFLPFQESFGFFENRSDIWQTAIAAGFKSPVIGHGFGNIQEPMRETAVELNNNVQYQVVDSAHNFLLDFWIQGGTVGLAAVLILIYLTIKSFIRHKKIIELTAFLGLMTAMLFNPVSVVNLLAFWWLIGTQS